ncbi:MAG TPA: hypothetical protein VK983_03435, partial [Candidatus Limnocylindrales bacterium]|nr:hypothetical protein [Candidatus Limnocylindrales bacterium]
LIQAPKNTVAAKTGTSSNSGSLGVTVVAGDKKHGIRTTTISVTNRDNIDTIPNSTYKGSSSMAAVFNKFFKRTRSDEALNLLSAYDQ